MIRGETPQFSDSLGFCGENWIGDLEAEVYVGTPVKDYSNNLIDKNIKALRQIAELSEKANVKLVIVSIPFHKSFRDLASPTQWSFTHSVIDSVINQYYNSLYLNYYSAEFPDSCYLNSAHLNVNGAKLFSTMLAHDIDSLGVFQH